jgi:hypothetical protein
MKYKITYVKKWLKREDEKWMVFVCGVNELMINGNEINDNKNNK